MTSDWPAPNSQTTGPTRAMALRFACLLSVASSCRSQGALPPALSAVAADSSAIRVCRDELSKGSILTCERPLRDGFVQVAVDSAARTLTIARYRPSTGLLARSVLDSTIAALTGLYGAPSNCRLFQWGWAAADGRVLVWLRSPDYAPVDSTKVEWAVLTIVSDRPGSICEIA